MWWASDYVWISCLFSQLLYRAENVTIIPDNVQIYPGISSNSFVRRRDVWKSPSSAFAEDGNERQKRTEFRENGIPHTPNQKSICGWHKILQVLHLLKDNCIFAFIPNSNFSTYKHGPCYTAKEWKSRKSPIKW